MPRPKQFDPQQALDRAVHLFWQKGFEAASMQDLVSAMGINRFSLYDTFGGKHDLFVAACTRYIELVKEQLLAPLYEPDASLPQIKQFLENVADRMASDDGQVGCLMTNTAAEMAYPDDAVRSLVADFLAEKERLLTEALHRARDHGQINRSTDPATSAGMLVAGVNGAILLNKVQRDPDRVRQNIRSLIRSVDRK